ncbi:MAG: hypothetical protein RXP91_06550 [Nitrososphaeria archaeon]
MLSPPLLLLNLMGNSAILIPARCRISTISTWPAYPPLRGGCSRRCSAALLL